MAVAPVEVNFTASPSRSEFTQNDSNQGIVGSSKTSFRKNGRKDRKKDSSRSSLLHNPNDMTGIPLKDDSSKASSSSQHFGPITVGFIPDKGWTFAAHNTPLEIAMYVLLGVFSVAILVFVASCFVYASRVKKRDGLGNSEDLLGGFKMMEGHPAYGLGMGMGRPGAGNGGACTNAHDWVWLGRASLALHPSLDSSKHPAFSTSSSCRALNSSNPIRIITNPNFESLQQQGQSQQHAGSMSPSPTTPLSQPGSSTRHYGRNSGSGGESSRAGAPPRPPKPGHSNSNTSSIDSSTFSVKQQGSGANKVSSPPGSVSVGGGDCPDYRPPVPPHRNIPMGSHNVEGGGSASPSPPRNSKSSSSSSSSSNSHNNLSKSSKGKRVGKGESQPKDDNLTNPTFLEFTEQKRREGNGPLRPANIVGNPMSYIDEESEIDDEEERPLTVAAASAVAARQGHKLNKGGRQNLNSSVKLDMDYDQLMEYFDNLKETEA